MSNKNSEIVFQYLKEKIIRNEWKNGEQITPEIQLAKELNVGRNAVREAIEKLVGMKVLVKKRGKGTFVETNILDISFNSMLKNIILDKKDYMDILVFRRTFEPENVKLFIQYATLDEFDELEKTFYKMTSSSANTNDFSYYDALFHNIIAKGTKNSVIIEISQILSELMLVHQKKLNKILGSTAGLKEHFLLLEAIKEKDSDLAYLLMRKHINRTIKDVEQVLNEKI